MENERAQVQILACSLFFMCLCICVEGFVHFLHIVAKGPTFPK